MNDVYIDTQLKNDDEELSEIIKIINPKNIENLQFFKSSKISNMYIISPKVIPMVGPFIGDSKSTLASILFFVDCNEYTSLFRELTKIANENKKNIYVLYNDTDNVLDLGVSLLYTIHDNNVIKSERMKCDVIYNSNAYHKNIFYYLIKYKGYSFSFNFQNFPYIADFDHGLGVGKTEDTFRRHPEVFYLLLFVRDVPLLNKNINVYIYNKYTEDDILHGLYSIKKNNETEYKDLFIHRAKYYLFLVNGDKYDIEYLNTRKQEDNKFMAENKPFYSYGFYPSTSGDTLITNYKPVKLFYSETTKSLSKNIMDIPKSTLDPHILYFYYEFIIYKLCTIING